MASSNLAFWCTVWAWGGCREGSWWAQQSLVQCTSHSRGTFACYWLPWSLLSTVWNGVSLDHSFVFIVLNYHFGPYCMHSIDVVCCYRQSGIAYLSVFWAQVSPAKTAEPIETAVLGQICGVSHVARGTVYLMGCTLVPWSISLCSGGDVACCCHYCGHLLWNRHLVLTLESRCNGCSLLSSEICWWINGEWGHCHWVISSLGVSALSTTQWSDNILILLNSDTHEAFQA